MTLSKKPDDLALAEMIRGLESAGLRPKEAQVYLSLLRSGQTGASQISRDTTLHGQFVYSALETLEKKGLVQHIIVRGRRKYSAKNPRHLSEQLAERKRQLDDLIKDIETKITVDPEHQFEIFQGQESFVANEMRLLQAMPEGGTILVIGGNNDGYIEKCGNAINELDYIRKKKNVQTRYIGAEAQKKDLDTWSENRFVSSRALPGVFEGSSNYGIYTEIGVFGLYVFTDPVTSFIVHNKKIADNFKTFFETLWKMGH